MATVFLHLLISFSLFPATAPPPPPSTAPTNCADELVRLSVCLPYISSYPNNLTRFPSSQCCHDVASAVISGTAICFCYLIRQPLMLGFPLNSTRLLSLAPLCRVKCSGNETISSLDSLCSGSPILPPLQSITGPDGLPKQNSGPSNPAPPSMCSEATSNAEAPAPVPEPMPPDDYFSIDPPHASAANVGTQPSFARHSRKWRWFIPQIMILAPHLYTYL